MKVRSVHAKVDLHVSVLLVCAGFKLFSESVKRDRLRTHDPGLVEVALFLRYPDVPEGLEFIPIVFMQELAGALDRLFRPGAEVIALFEETRLAEGDRMDRKISDTRHRLRKRKLLHHR